MPRRPSERQRIDFLRQETARVIAATRKTIADSRSMIQRCRQKHQDQQEAILIRADKAARDYADLYV